MINRALIRLKIIQLMYAYYQNGGKNIEAAEKELLFSLSKAYDLYNYLLLLIVAVTRYGVEQVERKEHLKKVSHDDTDVSHRFIDNKFVIQLESNLSLCEYVKNQKRDWSNDMDYIKKLYEDIVLSEYYKEYMSLEAVTYEDDKELWRKIYKNIIMKDTRIDEVLEEQSLYWNDDKEIVDTFVLKTIKRFNEKNREMQPLMEEYKDDEDKDFAIRLFNRAVRNDEYYRTLISQNVRNWEFSRLAYMDVVIMQVALAEILSFPAIPISVSINEYVEIAKLYSTPKSGSYINGILDAVVKKLRSAGKLPMK